ncbi:MAG: hypothetical protein Fur0023_16570 [Bacteroidia bacterium]
MAKQSNNVMKYCASTTKNHPLAKKHRECIEKISDACKTAGAKSSPFDQEICLNLDKVEDQKAKCDGRNKHKTMDIAFGIKSKEMILCDFKFNCENPNNLKHKDLKGKISYSEILLGQTISIHKPYLFLFESKIKRQALNLIRRLFTNKPDEVDVLDIDEFKKKYF